MPRAEPVTMATLPSRTANGLPFVAYEVKAGMMPVRLTPAR
jgi:hypothetical protein